MIMVWPQGRFTRAFNKPLILTCHYRGHFGNQALEPHHRDTPPLLCVDGQGKLSWPTKTLAPPRTLSSHLGTCVEKNPTLLEQNFIHTDIFVHRDPAYKFTQRDQAYKFKHRDPAYTVIYRDPVYTYLLGTNLHIY